SASAALIRSASDSWYRLVTDSARFEGCRVTPDRRSCFRSRDGHPSPPPVPLSPMPRSRLLSVMSAVALLAALLAAPARAQDAGSPPAPAPTVAPPAGAPQPPPVVGPPDAQYRADRLVVQYAPPGAQAASVATPRLRIVKLRPGQDATAALKALRA